MKSPTLDPRLDDRLADAERRFAGVEEALVSPEVLSSPDKIREFGQERSVLEPIVVAGRELREALEQHAEAVELMGEHARSAMFGVIRPASRKPARARSVTSLWKRNS